MATPNNNRKEITEYRRQEAGRLRLRGLSFREIAKRLEEAGHTNPKTGKPWSHTIIAKDLEVMSKQWRETAAADIAQHKANQLAEIQEARRVAWGRVRLTKEGELYSQEDIGEIRRLIELEAKLLGTNEPDRQIIGGMEDNPLLLKGYTNVSPDDL